MSAQPIEVKAAIGTHGKSGCVARLRRQLASPDASGAAARVADARPSRGGSGTRHAGAAPGSKAIAHRRAASTAFRAATAASPPAQKQAAAAPGRFHGQGEGCRRQARRDRETAQRAPPAMVREAALSATAGSGSGTAEVEEKVREETEPRQDIASEPERSRDAADPFVRFGLIGLAILHGLLDREPAVSGLSMDRFSRGIRIVAATRARSPERSGTTPPPAAATPRRE